MYCLLCVLYIAKYTLISATFLLRFVQRREDLPSLLSLFWETRTDVTICHMDASYLLQPRCRNCCFTSFRWTFWLRIVWNTSILPGYRTNVFSATLWVRKPIDWLKPSLKPNIRVVRTCLKYNFYALTTRLFNINLTRKDTCIRKGLNTSILFVYT